jgi:single-strand DNA-binding protein
MAHVHVIQRNAHLASAVQFEHVNTREGKLARAVLTAISNQYRGSGEAREQMATAIRWTLWGVQAEHAAAYLGKGSHVNLVGRVRNDVYQDGDGREVHGMAFTVDEIDYLDSRAEGEARRASEGAGVPSEGNGSPSASLRQGRSTR